MSAFAEFLQKMGGLHDTVVKSVAWHTDARLFAFTLEDIYQNFEGLPEYPGPGSGAIVLKGVSSVTMNLDSVDALRIDEFSVDESMSGDKTATISFWPQGKIVAKFIAAEYPECRLVRAPT